MSQQQTKNSITLRGSAQIICEYLKYAINSVLFQRGLYPPETFKAEQQYGITLLISDDPQIKSFLTNLLIQSEEWIIKKKVNKISLIILNVANKEVCLYLTKKSEKIQGTSTHPKQIFNCV